MIRFRPDGSSYTVALDAGTGLEPPPVYPDAQYSAAGDLQEVTGAGAFRLARVAGTWHLQLGSSHFEIRGPVEVLQLVGAPRNGAGGGL